MSSESRASSSGDEASEPNPNPIPKPPEDQLAALALSETDSHANGVVHGSAGENNQNHQEIESDEEEVEANSAAPGLAEVEESREGLPRGSVGGIVWARTNSEPEVDGPSSPSSSGYAGERGSSSASSGGSGIDEISEVRNEEVVDGFSDSQVSWVPGKRHVDEDDASLSWRKRKKHFFILSNSGKPIYSRHGDEHKLAGFSATLQAIISFVENGGDHVKLVRAGKHQLKAHKRIAWERRASWMPRGSC